MNRDLSAGGKTPASIFQTCLQYCSVGQQIFHLGRKIYLLSQNFKVSEKMYIILMIWPWTHINFVYMQKKWFGKVSCAYFLVQRKNFIWIKILLYWYHFLPCEMWLSVKSGSDQLVKTPVPSSATLTFKFLCTSSLQIFCQVTPKLHHIGHSSI